MIIDALNIDSKNPANYALDDELKELMDAASEIRGLNLHVMVLASRDVSARLGASGKIKDACDFITVDNAMDLPSKLFGSHCLLLSYSREVRCSGGVHPEGSGAHPAGLSGRNPAACGSRQLCGFIVHQITLPMFDRPEAIGQVANNCRKLDGDTQPAPFSQVIIEAPLSFVRRMSLKLTFARCALVDRAKRCARSLRTPHRYGSATGAKTAISKV
ncbi:MAG: hypothetical protein R3B54_07290 [Bdellovibrionota bacterium]